MNKELKYGGYSAQPSDYECQDGDLAMSLNLINEDGAIHATHKPKELFSVGVGYRLFIHRAGAITNYISYIPAGRTIKWIGSKSKGIFSSPSNITIGFDFGNIISVASVGYILIISTDSNIYYIRYNANKDAYIFLGTKLPDIFLQLGLKLNFTISDVQEKSFDVVVTSGSSSSSGTTTTDDDWQIVVATSYDVSGSNGGVTREDAITTSGHYVGTGYIPFDSTFKIQANKEYRLKWDVVAGAHYGMTLGIYGNRNGSSTREMLFWKANENVLANSIEVKKTFEDEWTNICYKIDFGWEGELSDAGCGTRGNITWYSGIDNSDTGSSDVTTYIEYTSDTHTTIMGVINKFVKEQVTDRSRFLYPFYVRYAVKLFDGSYGYLSEPILMIPNSGYVPAVQFSKHYSLGTRLIMTAFAADLQYKAENTLPGDWEDLITGIDIFVSQPIWAYNQGQEYDGTTNYFKFRSAVDSKGYGKAFFSDVACDSGNTYGRLELATYINRYATNIITNNYVQLATRSEEDIKTDAEHTTNFYKIASLSFGEINKATSLTDLKIEKGILNALVTREELVDNVLQYEGFKNGYLKEYNHRLHICHSSIILRNPSHPRRCFNFVADSDVYKLLVYVVLATDDGQKIVQTTLSGQVSGPWFFYPDGRAYKAYFILQDSAGSIIGISEKELKRHDYLNGAYWFGENFLDSLSYSSASVDPLQNTAKNNSIAALSTIYVSEANCPFVFHADTAVSVGAQEVKALATAAKALSQGQFGQFPLYAFSTEGIWALTVASTGVYTAVQPIVRDETIDIGTITQIDSAVLFVAQRGIMLLQGSQTRCISDYINNDYPFGLDNLPGINTLHTMIGHRVDTCYPIKPFNEFIKSCRMLYDYPHQRIYLYNISLSYAYVYSLKSKLWGLMYSNLRYNVNSYPEAYVINSDGMVVDYSEKSDEFSKGILITRPLQLDLPNIHKTIDTIIQRGNFAKGHVQSVLYGSRDLINWHLVWSSKDHYLRGFRGTPYKYFRIALVCDLQGGESIYGATVQFNSRLTNQPR